MSSKKVFASMDGNQAAAYCAYAFTEVAGIYPITPSTPMPEFVDLWASQGKKNLFGMPVKVVEMQSEAGAAGTVHGSSLLAGALTTTFTASQGLLAQDSEHVQDRRRTAPRRHPRLRPLDRRAGAVDLRRPSGRHGGPSDRFRHARLAAPSRKRWTWPASPISAAIKSSIPFLHFFDGFRTSHEVNKIEVLDYAVFDRLLDKT
ncbi:MAG: hypothetical protein MZU97_24440 [Bacillus subtilis]|nr:hypothetical protein [Bacillus subtilis]